MFAQPQARPFVLAISDGLCIVIAFLAAILLAGSKISVDAIHVLLGAVLFSCPVFVRAGLYRGLGFFTDATLRRGFKASGISALIIAGLIYFLNSPVPLTTPIIYFALLTLGTVGVRRVAETFLALDSAKQKDRVLIYGAGEAGQQLCQTLRYGRDYSPAAFVDDNPDLHGKERVGLKIYPREKIAHLIQSKNISTVLFAIPSGSPLTRQQILASLRELPVVIKSMPNLNDLIAGRAEIHDLDAVRIEDLLGRDVISPKSELLRQQTTGKRVCVTGAGGSIGSELCRQIIALAPEALVMLDHSEFSLYSIEQEMRAHASKYDLSVRIVAILGSVTDRVLVRKTLQSHRVQTLYHAAAYKHVPLVEQNVVAGIHNNVFGTQIVVDEAADAQIDALILISTDKAVRPTNIMGASKRLAERICEARASTHPATVFSMVRFGNVLGSSGSVIPKFLEQIKSGGPVTVTNPEITRYFMTITEAVQLVIQAGAIARGGDVFVLDMGEPVKILDLATRMIRLHGLTPYLANSEDKGDIAICFSGLRAGEKLYEELLISDKALNTDHPRIMTTDKQEVKPEVLALLLERLGQACESNDVTAIRDILTCPDTGYQAKSQNVDAFSSDLPL